MNSSTLNKFEAKLNSLFQVNNEMVFSDATFSQDVITDDNSVICSQSSDMRSTPSIALEEDTDSQEGEKSNEKEVLLIADDDETFINSLEDTSVQYNIKSQTHSNTRHSDRKQCKMRSRKRSMDSNLLSKQPSSNKKFHITVKKSNSLLQKANKLPNCPSNLNSMDSTDVLDITALISKNKARKNKNKYSGMKMMFDPQTGQHIVATNSFKPSNSSRFNIEPWMFEKPKILQESGNKLFLLSKNSKCNVKKTIAKESNSIFNPNAIGSNALHFIKENEYERDEIISDIPSSSKVIFWSEGNVDSVDSYVALTDKLKFQYAKTNSVKATSRNSSAFEIPDFLSGIETYDTPPNTKTGAASDVSVHFAWENVASRIEELQEETMTKFILQFKSRQFNDPPQPFRKIYYEVDTRRRGIPVIIPNTGMPFMIIGTYTLDCHLGKQRKDQEQTLARLAKTKKVGCPAQINIVKIARFPDFDISGLSPACVRQALNEVINAWDTNMTQVRYFMEYHMKEPSPAAHKGHEVQYVMAGNKFREPVDPRIIEKIRELARHGITGPTSVREKLKEFVKEEIFKGKENTSMGRRRYNPTKRDICYTVFKHKEELKKGGQNLANLQCMKLLENLFDLTRSLKEEKCVAGLKSCLMMLYEILKSDDKRQALNEFRKMMGEAIQQAKRPPPSHKQTRPSKRKKEQLHTSESVLVPDQGYIVNQLNQDEVVEQFYITVPDIPASAPDNMFNPQLYEAEFVNMNQGLVEAFQQPTPEDGSSSQVYYYYPDGSLGLMSADSLTNAQT